MEKQTAASICDSLEESFGTDSEARTIELERILNSLDRFSGYNPVVTHQQLASEATKRGWL